MQTSSLQQSYVSWDEPLPGYEEFYDKE